jgi:hypothetical protein
VEFHALADIYEILLEFEFSLDVPTIQDPRFSQRWSRTLPYRGIQRHEVCCKSTGGYDENVTVLNSRILKPGGPVPCIYIAQKEGGPALPKGTGFIFRRLLRLAGTTVEVF